MYTYLNNKKKTKKNLLYQMIFILIILINIITTLYFGIIHQRGAIEIIKYINNININKNITIDFLMVVIYTIL